jgi:DmsE family decaheme c-type cytochrome
MDQTRLKVPVFRWILLLPVAVLIIGATVLTASPGSYVGDETCMTCHEEIVEGFEKSAHALRAWPDGDEDRRCEACHGLGEAHAEADGAVDKIVVPGKEDSSPCMACHGSDVGARWEFSAHESYDVHCSNCHRVHAPWTNDYALVNTSINKACLSCHADMQKHLNQRSSHPLKFGRMSCTSCHEAHGSETQASIAAVTPNDKCYECHAEKRGPFLFEHAPVREDCGTCHNPHGSNQTMLLTMSAPRLCQSCHLFGHHQTVPGQPTQIWNQNRSCLNCHPRIHGSNHPSGVIFMR